MAIRLKTGLILVVIAATLLVALFFLVPVLLNLDRYRPEVISYLQDKTGKPLEIGRLTLIFSPTVSIRVDDLGIKNPAEFPPGYLIKVARIDAEVDARALLCRQIVIKSVVVENPVINLVSDPDGPWNFENAQSKTLGKLFLGVIPKMEIRGGHLTASNLLISDAPGLTFFEAHNISSHLEQFDLDAFIDPSSSSVAARGDWTADSLRFGAIQATKVKSKVRLLTKQAFFTDASLKAYSGRVAGDLSFDLSGKNASFKADARLSGINVAHLLAAFPHGGGKMTGTMEGHVKLAGEIEHSLRPLAGIHGAGHVTVRNGQVPELKLNENLMKLAHFNDLGPAKKDPSSFSFISTDLELANLRIASSVIDIDGYGVDVQGSGNLSLAGAESLDYRGVAEILTKQGFFTNTIARLSGATLKDGKLSLPFRVSGTIQSPRFSMEKKAD